MLTNQLLMNEPKQKFTLTSSNKSLATKSHLTSRGLVIQKKESFSLEINDWQIAEHNRSYLVNTAGCGAIKLFMSGNDLNYSIVFHCFGNSESKEVSQQIGQYIASQKDKTDSVKILNIQPYGISADIDNCINEIRKILREKTKIELSEKVICLNNIEYPKYSRFITVDLEGSENEIISRYEHFVLKDIKLSPEDRQKKIKLFQTIPINERTPEFIRKWSSLTLEQSQELVAKMEKHRRPIRRFFYGLISCITCSKYQ